MTWEIRQGDVLDRLGEIPDESVQCVVTSPPYFGLRDYGVEGQIGLEPTLDEYLDHLVAVFAEVRRVLRTDGTLWLNIGDSYASKPRGEDGSWDAKRIANPGRIQKQQAIKRSRRSAAAAGAKPKDLMMVPALLALALRDDGWWLRSEVIWSKPNPMPESITDRPTRAHEQLYLLSRAPRYFYDAEGAREPYRYGHDHHRNVDHPPESHVPGAPKHVGLRRSGNLERTYGETVGRPGPGGDIGRAFPWQEGDNGRNRRSVWEISTKPYPAAHFATFPPDLVEPCILAGSSDQACVGCGAPWRRRTEITYENPGNRTTNGPRSVERKHLPHGTAGYERRLERRVTTVGWEPTCDHAEGGGLVDGA